jgi:hypothetical protein
MGILANENAIGSGAGGYQITNSLRFNNASTQFLNRTNSTNGSLTTWTWSAWVKRGSLGTGVAGTGQCLVFGGAYSGSAPNNQDALQFQINNNLEYFLYNGSSTVIQLITSQVFRDPSAWYHIILSVDTTQATASNRVKLYVNGSQVTSFSTATYPTQNLNTYINGNTYPQRIGRKADGDGAAGYLNAYITEVNFVNAQALTPSSFGETDSTTGQWIAKKYTGTYGTNGYYLPFSNGTSTTTLGADSSGNSNNWTLNNFVRSAGATDCWMNDAPSGNGSSGVRPNSNYAVLNPVQGIAPTLTSGSTSNTNLTATTATTTGNGIGATMVVNGGKFYWEVTPVSGVTTAAVACSIGIRANSFIDAFGGGSYTYESSDTPTYTNGDVIGLAYDGPNNTLYCYKNNTLAKTITSIPSDNPLLPGIRDNITTAIVANFNFGQRAFTYSPPSGYLALCTNNLPVPSIKQSNKYIDSSLYTGNGTATGNTQVVTNSGTFQPDLVWIKARNDTTWNLLYDSVRGINNPLSSNQTAAQSTVANTFSSFNSNGFTVDFNSGFVNTVTTNENTRTYVGWQWRAGNGVTSSNTNGSLTSTTSVNATAGFSIVTYTGNATTNATVGHGLGVTPKFIIIKNKSAVADWLVYTTAVDGSLDFLFLNTTAAKADSGSNLPTSNVFSLSSAVNTNGSGNTMIAYCFSEIPGFSKFGSYVGNGNADGAFVYCGFNPEFLMVKRTDTTGDWNIVDAARNTFNPETLILAPNQAALEAASGVSIDFLSNGFKIRSSSFYNTASGTFLYMAFAANPFQYANAR